MSKTVQDLLTHLNCYVNSGGDPNSLVFLDDMWLDCCVKNNDGTYSTLFVFDYTSREDLEE